MNGEDAASERTRSRPSPHVHDVIPAFVSDTLDESARRSVLDHVVYCRRCRQELESWQVLASATRVADDPAQTPTPSPALLRAVWARIDVPTESSARQQRTSQGSLLTWASAGLLLARSQVRVVRPGIWIASSVATLICLAPLLWPAALSSSGASVHIAVIQSFLSPLVTALGLAFLYGPGIDAGFEITLSTPVSPRRILLCRLLLAVCYNVVLSLAVTLIAVGLHGGNLALLISFWMGPMLLLSGLSLALSIGVSAIVGSAVTSALWIFHFFVSSISTLPSPTAAEHTPLAVIWQTTPATLVVAALLFVLAVIYVPRQTPHIEM